MVKHQHRTIILAILKNLLSPIICAKIRAQGLFGSGEKDFFKVFTIYGIYIYIYLYMAFLDLEKASERVPRKVIWWALRKLGVEEWIVRLVQGMYANARSHVRVGEGYSEEFEVKVGVHQGSVLSPLLFIIVPEALSQEFRSGVPWENLYADDLVIIAESLEECVRLLTWKEAMEKKRTESKCRKVKDHDLLYGTGPPAEFRRVSMRCLSHWSGQQ